MATVPPSDPSQNAIQCTESSPPLALTAVLAHPTLADLDHAPKVAYLVLAEQGPLTTVELRRLAKISGAWHACQTLVEHDPPLAERWCQPDVPSTDRYVAIYPPPDK